MANQDEQNTGTGNKSQISAVSRAVDELLSVTNPHHPYPTSTHRGSSCSAAGPAPPPSAWWGCFSDLHFIDASHIQPFICLLPLSYFGRCSLNFENPPTTTPPPPPTLLFSFSLLCFSQQYPSLLSFTQGDVIFRPFIKLLTTQPVLDADMKLHGSEVTLWLLGGMTWGSTPGLCPPDDSVWEIHGNGPVRVHCIYSNTPGRIRCLVLKPFLDTDCDTADGHLELEMSAGTSGGQLSRQISVETPNQQARNICRANTHSHTQHFCVYSRFNPTSW